MLHSISTVCCSERSAAVKLHVADLSVSAEIDAVQYEHEKL